MKHVLNFVPTAKYRGESSFMFKTIIGLLYTVPLMMVTAMTIDYVDLDRMIGEVQAMTERLDTRTAEFSRTVNETRPDREEYQAGWDRILDYHRSLRASSLSWTTLFGFLEEVQPAGVRVRRVRVRPHTAGNLTIEGEALRLEEVTSFLRRLYEHPRFTRPRLVRHSRLEGNLRKEIEAGLAAASRTSLEPPAPFVAPTTVVVPAAGSPAPGAMALPDSVVEPVSPASGTGFTPAPVGTAGSPAPTDVPATAAVASGSAQAAAPVAQAAAPSLVSRPRDLDPVGFFLEVGYLPPTEVRP